MDKELSPSNGGPQASGMISHAQRYHLSPVFVRHLTKARRHDNHYVAIRLRVLLNSAIIVTYGRWTTNNNGQSNSGTAPTWSAGPQPWSAILPGM